MRKFSNGKTSKVNLNKMVKYCEVVETETKIQILWK